MHTAAHTVRSRLLRYLVKNLPMVAGILLVGVVLPRWTHLTVGSWPSYVLLMVAIYAGLSVGNRLEKHYYGLG